MKQDASAFEQMLRNAMADRPLSTIEELTGVPKATLSRLTNGKYKGRPSAAAIWKLTHGELPIEDEYSYRNLMCAAGYSDAEIQKRERKYSQEFNDTELSSWERKCLRSVEAALVGLDMKFRTQLETGISGIHTARIVLDNPECQEWLLMFNDMEEPTEEDLEKLIGKCTFQIPERRKKISVVMASDVLKKYAYRLSFLGNLSVIVCDCRGIINEEVYISDRDGDKAFFVK